MAELTRKKKAAKLFVRSVFIVVTLFVLLAFATCAWFSTETGRVWSSEKVLGLVSKRGGLNLHHADIRSKSLGHIYIGELSVFQKREPLVKARQLELKWQIFALLTGKITIDSLSAESVKIFKLPQGEKQKASQSSSLPRLPKDFTLANVNLKKFHIRSLDLAALVHGQKTAGKTPVAPLASTFANIELKANADTTSANFLALTLSVRSDTNPIIEIAISGQPKDSSHYAIEVQAKEQARGFIAEYAKLPEKESFDLRLSTVLHYDKQALVVKLEDLSFPISSRRIHTEGLLNIDQKLSPIRAHIKLALSTDDSDHEIQGDIVDDRLNFQIALERFPLDIFSPWLSDLDNGHISSQLSIGGTLAAPRVEGELSVQTRYKKNKLSAAAEGSLHNNILDLMSSHIKLNESIAKAHGKIFIDQQDIDLSVEVSKLKLASIRALEPENYGLPAIPQDLTFTIPNLKARLQGPLKRPLGNVEFLGSGTYRGIDFGLSANIDSREEALEINQLIATSAGGESQLVGSLNIDSLESDLFVKANNLPLELLTALQIDLPRDFSATLAADAHIQGSIRQPQIEGELLLVGNYQSLPFSLDAQGKYIEQEISINKALLQSGDNTLLAAKGFYKKDTFDFNLRIDELPTTFFEAFGWTPYPGTLAADLSLSGTIDTPHLTGSASYVTQTRIIDDNNQQQILPLEVKINAGSGHQSLSLLSTFLRDETETGRLAIDIPYGIFDKLTERLKGDIAQFPIAANVTGSADLQALAFLALSDLHRLDGIINTQLSATGTIGKPDIDGTISISQGEYENFVSGTVLTDIACDINSKNSLFTLTRCEANDGHAGEMTLVGQVELPLNPYHSASAITLLETTHSQNLIDLGLHLKSFTPLEQPDIEAEISGKVTATGNFDKLYIRGEVEVSPLNIDISSSFDSNIPSIDVNEVYDLSKLSDITVEKPPGHPEIFVDLKVNTEKQAYLRGRGLDVELGGKIKISGSASNIKYHGKFETLRGTAEIFNKKFAITQGEVRFIDSHFSMLLKAEYEKYGQKIVATISGSNDDLKLELSATPSMAEDEILAFILFGKSVAKISPFEAIQLAAAVQKLRGGKSLFDPIGSARDILAVDSLSVSTEETEAGSSGVNIGIGKYINERVYLEFERTPNPSQPWRARLEIQLLPNLMLESSSGGKTGVEGAQLKWKRDY